MASLIPAIPTQSDVVEISADQDWTEAWECSYYDTDGVTEIPRDFTDCSVIGGLAIKNGAARVDLTSTGGSPNLTISGNIVAISVARSVINALPDGLYAFDLTRIDSLGRDLGLIRGTRKVIHGALT